MTLHRGSGVALALVIGVGGVTGCGGGSPDTEVVQADREAKHDLAVVYRTATRAAKTGVRCSTSPSARCDYPRGYPRPHVLVAEVGSELLDKLKVALVKSVKDVTVPNVIFILARRTDAKSIALATKTPSGTIWMLSGSSSRYRIKKLQ